MSDAAIDAPATPANEGKGIGERLRSILQGLRQGAKKTADETAAATADATKVGLATNGIVLGAWLFAVWAAGLVWAIVCAIGSATANVYFYKSLALTPFDAAVLTAIGVAFECGLVALLPISERVRRAGDPATAKKLRGFWSACLVASFVAALGFYAVALWEAQAPKATADRLQVLTIEEVGEAKRELDAIDRPTPPRAVAELDGLIAASLARPAIDRDGNPRRISLDRATNGCAAGTPGRAFRDQCPEVLELRAERARAVRKNDLQAKLEANRETLKTSTVETTAGVHPLFGIIARVTGSDGGVVQLAFLVLISALTVASAGFGPHLLLDALGAVRRSTREAAAAAADKRPAEEQDANAGRTGQADPNNEQAAGEGAGENPFGDGSPNGDSGSGSGSGSGSDAGDKSGDPPTDPDPPIDPPADPDPPIDPPTPPADPVPKGGDRMTFTPGGGAGGGRPPRDKPLAGGSSSWEGRVQRVRDRFRLGR